MFRPLVRGRRPDAGAAARALPDSGAVGRVRRHRRRGRLVLADGTEQLVGHGARAVPGGHRRGAEAVVVVGTDFGRDTGESGAARGAGLQRAAGRRVRRGRAAGGGRARPDGPEAVAAAVRAAYQRADRPGRDRAGGGRQPGRRRPRRDRRAGARPGELPVPAYVDPRRRRRSARRRWPRWPTPSTRTACSATTRPSTATRWTSWSAARMCRVFLDHLTPTAALVITPGDRADLLVARARRARRRARRRSPGVVLTLGERPDRAGPDAGRAAARRTAGGLGAPATASTRPPARRRWRAG